MCLREIIYNSLNDRTVFVSTFFNLYDCFLLKGGQCSHIHDSDEDNLSITENISDQLSSLERPNDTMPITIMCISHQRSHKKALTLYYCIASGDTSENISGYSAQWTISKVRLNNDALHDKIVSHWSENFLRKLTTTQRQNWKENSPAFLATDSFPFSDDSIIGQLIPAEKNHVRNQAAYTYSHQEDSSLYIRLFTPRSPPRVEVAGASKDSADIRLIIVEVRCVSIVHFYAANFSHYGYKSPNFHGFSHH